MAGKSVRTITEHILNQARDWALGGEVAASAFGALLLSWEQTLAAGPSACHSRSPGLTPPSAAPEEILSHLLQVSEPDKSGATVKSHTACPTPCPRLATSRLPPCCPSCGWAVSPVLWGGFGEQMGIPLRRWKKASGTERKGQRLKEESYSSSE